MRQNMFNRAPFVTALAGMVLAIASFANASTMGAEQVQKHAKQGTLKITATTDVGGITLQPGEYEVKQVNTNDGPVVRFTLYTYNAYAQEGLPSQEWETVGEVKVSVQRLEEKATRTQLAGSSGKAIGLQIRGNSFEYLFTTA